MAFIGAFPVTSRLSRCTAVSTKSVSPSSLSTFVRSPRVGIATRHECVRDRRESEERLGREDTKMVVISVGSPEEMDEVLSTSEDSLVVVNYSTTWCGPCKMFNPVYEELSEKYSEVVFVKVIGDSPKNNGSDLMRREGIRAVPAFHFWKSQKRIKEVTGARKDEVENTLKEYK